MSDRIGEFKAQQYEDAPKAILQELKVRIRYLQKLEHYIVHITSKDGWQSCLDSNFLWFAAQIGRSIDGQFFCISSLESTAYYLLESYTSTQELLDKMNKKRKHNETVWAYLNAFTSKSELSFHPDPRIYITTHPMITPYEPMYVFQKTNLLPTSIWNKIECFLSPVLYKQRKLLQYYERPYLSLCYPFQPSLEELEDMKSTVYSRKNTSQKLKWQFF